MSKQKTINEKFSLQGKGLHTGLDIAITFCPASEGHGIRIKRVDLPEQPEIMALADFVVSTNRGTILKCGDVQVSTIEHALSALYATEVDNCLIEVNAPEFPILDGSAKYYYENIVKIGTKEQKEERDYYIVTKRIEEIDPETGARIVMLPDNKYSIDVHIGYDSPILNNQYASLDNLHDFGTEIAVARTFVFVREIETLINQDLIKGGDLQNAIVIYDKKTTQESFDKLADLTGQEQRDANQLGYLCGTLHFDNEPARHKLLDVVGDLSLIGKPIKGKIIATYPGHKINTAIAKRIRRTLKKQEVQTPIYDVNKAPVLNVEQIREMLPHRWPFLMLDKVIGMGDNYVIGVKNITVNETLFMGHFPQEPLFPGVLMIEAMAQTGGILVLHTLPDPENYSTYFMKIDNVKFRQKVTPGDTVIFHVSLMNEVRRGIATMKGYAFVGENIVAEAEFMAQIIKNK